MSKEILGIDIGGSGIKAAIVDIKKGELISERIKYATPKQSTPQAVMDVIIKLIQDHKWKGQPIGIGFPAIVKDGITHTATNVDDTWLEFPIQGFLSKKLKCDVSVINDADAAGIAELKFGTPSAKKGKTIFLTLGTGIGSAIFNDGVLWRNSELGHLKYKDSIVEKYAANSIREKQELSYKAWGKELNKVLKYMERLLSPDRFLIGGGISKKFDKYEEYLKTEAKIDAAKLQNHAGIIGAALGMKE